jgi:hypothetical protein
MHQGALVEEIEQISRLNRLAVMAAFEVPLIFGGIMLYIWRWQHSAPLAWIPLLAMVLVSHGLHRDTARDLGLAATGMRASAEWVLPLAVFLYVPMLIYGFLHHRLALISPTWQALVSLLGYGIWCAFQQYLAQSYFNNRLMLVMKNRHVSSILTGILFSAAHIPNPILMVATLVAGFVFAEVFARHRNIWPLAFAQAVGGLLLAAVSPAAVIHHMRVGPSYFFYGIR